MPVLPKPFLVLGASLLTARTAHRLARDRADAAAQRRAYRALMRALAQTEHGRQLGIRPDEPYEAFRARVPLRPTAGFSAAIERMKRGEADVLWPGRCGLYARTSGTTAPAASLPLTEPMLKHFRRAAAASLLQYAVRVGHCGVFRGRHLLLDAAPAPAPILEARPFVAVAGSLGAAVALNLPPWARRHFYEPGLAITAMPEWTARLSAIVERAPGIDVTLLAGSPRDILMLSDALRRDFEKKGRKWRTLRDVWPNLECIVHSGVPIAPYQEELRRLAGASVKLHEVYVAAEAFIAAQESDPEAGLRVLDDCGVFLEFVALSDYDDALPASLGARAVPLERVRAGVDYVPVVTTPAGLCRCDLGDVVRFTSVNPPRLVYVGRVGLRLNAFGERVMERDVTDTLVAVCQRHGWSIVNFHVAPVVASTLTGQKRGRHEWWVELRPGTMATPTGPLLAAELDRELSSRSADYAGKRRSGTIEAPSAKLVMPGFFEHWMKHQGEAGASPKLPRCRSDRRIADDLTALACFTPD